jgi:glutathione S-transferase
MHSVALVILVALIEFLALGLGMVSYARRKYGVKPPAISGHEMFERHFRVHYNTLEQLIIFLPSVWLYGLYISESWATILGAIFIMSRILYAVGYVANPDKRAIGSVLSTAAVVPLLLGAIYGAARMLLSQAP